MCKDCGTCGTGLLNTCDRAECEQIGRDIAKNLGTSGSVCGYTSGLLRGKCEQTAQCAESEKNAKESASKSSAKPGSTGTPSVKPSARATDLSAAARLENGFCLIQSPEGAVCADAASGECGDAPVAFERVRLCQAFADRLGSGRSIGLAGLDSDADYTVYEDGFCMVTIEDVDLCLSAVDGDCVDTPAVFPSIELCDAFVQAGVDPDHDGDGIPDAEDPDWWAQYGLNPDGSPIDDSAPSCVKAGVCTAPGDDACLNGVVFPNGNVCGRLYRDGPSALCGECGSACSETTCQALGACALDQDGACVPFQQ